MASAGCRMWKAISLPRKPSRNIRLAISPAISPRLGPKKVLSSTALVRYRMSDYSVPTAYGFRDVVVKGFVDQVVIFCGGFWAVIMLATLCTEQKITYLPSRQTRASCGSAVAPLMPHSPGFKWPKENSAQQSCRSWTGSRVEVRLGNSSSRKFQLQIAAVWRTRGLSPNGRLSRL